MDREVRGSGNLSSKSAGSSTASEELLGNLTKAAKPEDRATTIQTLMTSGLTPSLALKMAYAHGQSLPISSGSSSCISRAMIYTGTPRPFCADLYYYYFFSSFLTKQTRLAKCSTPY